MDVDLSGVPDVGREIASAIADICLDELGDDLETLLFHGSAIKGGMIEGSSDFDFVMIVRPGCLTPGDELPLAHATELHCRLATIDPAPFRYLQGHICPRHRPPGAGFIAGTYAVVLGSPDIPLATSEQLLAAAHTSLANLDRARGRDRLANALLNHGEERLYREVRWLCTDVWPVSFHIACVVENNGLVAWQRNKLENVSFLQDDAIVGQPLVAWLEIVSHHYAAGETVESGLAAITAGAAFLDAAAEWYQHYRKAQAGDIDA